MSASRNQSTYYYPLVILTVLFFMWGFLTSMNDILIPHLKNSFDLSNFQSSLVQFAFFGAYFFGSVIYFLISAQNGDPINKIGYQNGLSIGLVIAAFGAFLFYPAAHFASYSFFLLALFTLGLGFTLIQICANPYVAILGPDESASSRLNLSQGFNSLGTTLGPLLGGFLIFEYFKAAGGASVDAVTVPYLVLAGMLFLLAILVKVANLPDFRNDETVSGGTEVFKYRHLIFGMIAIFMYVGSEVSIGSWIIIFLKEDYIAGLDENAAKIYVSLYWGGLMVGRFTGAISFSDLPRPTKWGAMIAVLVVAFGIVFWQFGGNNALFYGIFLLINFAGFVYGASQPARTTWIFGAVASILLLVTLSTTGKVAMWSLVCIGLFNSIMWSNIFTLSIKGLGKHTSQGSSLLVMMIVGGAIFPSIQGIFADLESIGIHYSFVVPLIGYLYITWYGMKGYQIQQHDQN